VRRLLCRTLDCADPPTRKLARLSARTFSIEAAEAVGFGPTFVEAPPVPADVGEDVDIASDADPLRITTGPLNTQLLQFCKWMENPLGGDGASGEEAEPLLLFSLKGHLCTPRPELHGVASAACTNFQRTRGLAAHMLSKLGDAPVAIATMLHELVAGQNGGSRDSITSVSTAASTKARRAREPAIPSSDMAMPANDAHAVRLTPRSSAMATQGYAADTVADGAEWTPMVFHHPSGGLHTPHEQQAPSEYGLGMLSASARGEYLPAHTYMPEAYVTIPLSAAYPWGYAPQPVPSPMYHTTAAPTAVWRPPKRPRDPAEAEPNPPQERLAQIQGMSQAWPLPLCTLPPGEGTGDPRLTE
jgi:hypothetical protein